MSHSKAYIQFDEIVAERSFQEIWDLVREEIPELVPMFFFDPTGRIIFTVRHANAIRFIREEELVLDLIGCIDSELA